MAMWAAFKNIAEIRKSQRYREDPELRLFTQALWAGLAAYLAGACFASTEYNLYPYFMVGYTCAMLRISSEPLTRARTAELRAKQPMTGFPECNQSGVADEVLSVLRCLSCRGHLEDRGNEVVCRVAARSILR